MGLENSQFNESDLNSENRAPKIPKDIIIRAKNVASKFGKPKNFQEFEDLTSDALLGYVLALNKFDPKKGYNEMGLAFDKMKRGVQDGVRSSIDLGRWYSNKIKNIEAERQKLREKLGHEPSHEDVINSLGIKREEYDRLLNFEQNSRSVSLDGLLDTGAEFEALHKSQLDMVETAQQSRILKEAIEKVLYPREKQVFLLRLNDAKISNVEIAQKLGITVTNVNVSYSRGLAKLKDYFKEKNIDLLN